MSVGASLSRVCLLVAVTAAASCGGQESIEFTFTRGEPSAPDDEARSIETTDDSTSSDSRDGEQADASSSNMGPELGEVPADPLACFTYIEALCERFAECRNLPVVSEGCLASAVGCTGLEDGATTSTEELLDCASQYSSFECNRILQGRRLRCLSEGTQPAGEPCTTSLSCQSLICDYDPELGRYCAARAEPGGECPLGTSCTFGEQCVDGQCQPIPPPDFTNGNLPLGARGDDCRDPHQCQEGLFCHFAGDMYLGVCERTPRAGEPCGRTRGYDWPVPLPVACDVDSYCVDESCAPLPGPSEPCAESAFVDQRPCSWGLYCERAETTCQPWKQPGEACVGSAALSGLTGLPLDPECDPEQGARCSCVDDAESCVSGERICRIRVKPGEDCDFEFATCTYGTRCVDGFCNYAD